MEHLKRAFSLDHRSVRLFRIALGFLLIVQAINLTREIPRFLTESGLTPLSLVSDSIRDLPVFLLDFYRLPGAAWILTCLLAASGILLITNKAPRWGSFLACLVLHLLYYRNPDIMYAADHLMRVMCFWSILLPAGPSVPGENRFTNFASAGALCQISLLYIFTGLLKSSSDWNVTGNAVYLTLHADLYLRPFGVWMGEHIPLSVLSLMTVAILWWERMGSLLIFSPFFTAWTRTIAFIGFSAMHLNFAYSMYVGIFPATDLVFLLLLIPGEFWNFFFRFRVLHGLPSLKQQSEFEPWLMISPALAAIALGLIIFTNLRSVFRDLNLPDNVAYIAYRTSLAQNWGMFAPKTFTEDCWWVIEGKTKSGWPVDLTAFKKGFADFRKPKVVVDRYPSERWISYVLGLSHYPDKERARLRFGDYYCEKWNESSDDPLAEVRLWQVREPTLDAGRGRFVKSTLIIARDCEAGAASDFSVTETNSLSH